MESDEGPATAVALRRPAQTHDSANSYGTVNARLGYLVQAHVPGVLRHRAGLREPGTADCTDHLIADARMRNCKL